MAQVHQPPSSHDEWLNLFSHISSLLYVPPKGTSHIPDLDAPTTAQLIDHTLLTPTGTATQISVLCAEARQHRFRTVCVRSNHVAQAKRELSNSPVGIAAVIGFPTDATPPSYTTDQKVSEARSAIAAGATELDMVLDYEALKDDDAADAAAATAHPLSDDNDQQQQKSIYTAIYDDIMAVRSSIPDSAVLKVILETSQISDEGIARATVISYLAGADFVKTSTGFRGHGATIEAVQLMRSVCDVCEAQGLRDSKRVRVKASGGIKTIDHVRKMVSVGAERVGASAGVAIMEGLAGKGSVKVARDITETTEVGAECFHDAEEDEERSRGGGTSY